MSLMLKLSTTLVATTLLANAEFNVEGYVKKDLIKNPNIKVKGVEILKVKDLKDAKDWKAYLFLMNLEIGGRSDKYPETVFVNEKNGLLAKNLYNYKTHKKIGQKLRPNVDIGYYQDSHLIAGKKRAKHKLVVFSDPMCPFCQKNVPAIYEDVKKYPDDFTLYYYHMPLTRIHPVSEVLTRVMIVLQQRGRIDDVMKMYRLKISINEKNEKKILAEIKKQFNIDISQADINKPEIKEQLKKDKDRATRVMLKGTPTVYLDGKYDPEVNSYKKLIKK